MLRSLPRAVNLTFLLPQVRRFSPVRGILLTLGGRWRTVSLPNFPSFTEKPSVPMLSARTPSRQDTTLPIIPLADFLVVPRELAALATSIPRPVLELLAMYGPFLPWDNTALCWCWCRSFHEQSQWYVLQARQYAMRP